MIANNNELEGTLQRIQRFLAQVRHLRTIEMDPTSYRLMASGWLAEVDKMNREVVQYLAELPGQTKTE